MTKQEVNKLLSLMKVNYSYAFKNMSQQDKYLLLNTWTFALQDLDVNVVMLAVMQIISVSKWLPTVAEIREKCKDLHYKALSFSNGDPIMELFIESGQVTQAQMQAYEDDKQKWSYIAKATSHLRGNGPAALQLSKIPNTQMFHSLGAGDPCFSAFGESETESFGRFMEENA